jgi:peptidoglycan/LPS O-acetylase OafA/YrhL
MFLVVFSHYTQGVYVFGIRNFYWVTIGGFGVTLFLILSGMCLEYSYGGQKYSYTEFVRKRLRRIYPSYWLSFAASILLGVTTLPCDAFSFLMILTAFEVFSTRALEPWGTLLYAVGWFIGVIVILYFLYPFLSRAVRASPQSTILLALLTSLVSRVLVGNYWAVAGPTDWFPPCRLFEFTFGIWLVNRKEAAGFLANLNIRRGRDIVAYASDLSYPVYLVHLVVLGFINMYGAAIGNPLLFLLAFIVGTFVLSNIVFFMESVVLKQWRKLSRLVHVGKGLGWKLARS